MSVSRDIYSRFSSECARRGASVQSVADALITAELDRLESGTNRSPRFIAARSGKRSFQVRHLAYLRIKAAADDRRVPVRDFTDRLINAMLNQVGAP